jgi:hypothetical protein
MFVDNVQLVEGQESATRIGALVRLHSVDPIPDVGSYVNVQTWLLEPRIPSLTKLILANGERSPTGVLPAADPNQVAGEVIKRTTQVVDAVPQVHAEIVGDPLGFDRVVAVLKSFSFDLGSERVETTLIEPLAPIAERISVSLCPPHLEVYGVKIGLLRPFHHALPSTHA